MSTEVDARCVTDSTQIYKHHHTRLDRIYKFDTKCMQCINQAMSDMQRFKMNFEKYRIKTFKNWPISWINPRELAKDGFYYTGVMDIVKCNFCYAELYDWDADDSVEMEHKRHSPYCRVNLGLEEDNIPIKTITIKTEDETDPSFIFGWFSNKNNKKNK